MLVGASYYPETLPRKDWERDLFTARDIGLSVLRCGEFAWSAISGKPGEWDIRWAIGFLDIAYKTGFKVVWCTPSATPPPYVFDSFPDLVARRCDGESVPVGIRRNYCPSHMGYRELAAQMAGQLARDLSGHPAIMGWQVDNEIAGDGFTCWCGNCRDKFQAWLRGCYGEIDKLNCAWQTDVWSQRYTDWSQIPVPQQIFASHAPSLRMAYRRFRSDNWLEFYNIQAEELRRNGAIKICTNYFNYTWDVPFDQWKWREHMDAAGLSNYLEDEGACRFQIALLKGASSERLPLWILEQKAGQQRAQNILPDDNKRLRDNLRINREAGAEIAVYWHLRQHSAGCEQEHGAVLRHDGKPGKIAELIRRAIAETSGITTTEPSGKCVLLFSFEQHWANEQRPAQGDKWSYIDTLQQWHSSACDVFGQVEVVSPQGIADRCPDAPELILAPHMQIRRSMELAALLECAANGSAVVITADCGRLDAENNVIREAPLAFLYGDSKLSGKLPCLEILSPQKEYGLSGKLGGKHFSADSFWAFPDDFDDDAMQDMALGELSSPDGELCGPMALCLRYGSGRLIILMCKPEVTGVKALLATVVNDTCSVQ